MPKLSNTERIRRLCLALPEATEEFTWDDINFRVRKKIFCFPAEDGMTIKAEPDERQAMEDDPRFAPAPYLGRHGWVTMTFDKKPDWEEIGDLVATSYCLIAPKTLARQVTAHLTEGT